MLHNVIIIIIHMIWVMILSCSCLFNLNVPLPSPVVYSQQFIWVLVFQNKPVDLTTGVMTSPLG